MTSDPSSTDFEKQRQAIINARQGNRDLPVTPIEFVMHALRYDPELDGLYLCGSCGLTYDHECAYGGWHTAEQLLHVHRGDQPCPP